MAKNVLLVSPPFERLMGYRRFYYPVGLVSLAAVLKEQGHSVNVYDMDHDANAISMSPEELMNNYNNYSKSLNNDNHYIWKELDSVINSFNPDFIGISVFSSALSISKKIIEYIKNKYPNIKIGVGGVHATLRPNDFIGLVDYVMTCEGENIICDVVEGKLPSGLVNGTRVNNLDELPFPSLTSLYDLDSYTKNDLSLVLSSRGCPNACAFCNSPDLWNRMVTRKSPKYFYEELKRMVEMFGITDFYISDDTFTFNRKWLDEFLPLIKSLDVTYRCLSRIDIVDDNLIKSLKDSGCRNIKFGIESGSQRILDMIDKKIRVEQILEADKILRANEMDWSAFFIIGFPGETVEDIRRTQEVMRRISASGKTVNVFTPLPNNRLLNSETFDDTKEGFHSLHNLTGNIPDELFERLVKETQQIAGTSYSEYSDINLEPIKTLKKV